MQDLNDMLYFAEVVERGGFAAAGRALGIPKSRLSRRVSELEEQLGVRLLQRTTRKISLTEVGQAYLSHCQAVRESAQAAADTVAQVQAEPRGTLRVSCPVTLAQTAIGALIPEFLRRNPLVRLEMIIDNRAINPVDAAVDVALRVRPTVEDSGSMVVKRLDISAVALLASPKLLEQQGVPKTIDDLQQIDSIAMSAPDGRTSWNLLGPNGVERIVTHRPRFVADDLLTLKMSAVAGIGMCWLPVYMCVEELRTAQLVQVLPEWTVPSRIVHAVFPSRRGLSPAVRSFLDYLAEYLPGKSTVDAAEYEAALKAGHAECEEHKAGRRKKSGVAISPSAVVANPAPVGQAVKPRKTTRASTSAGVSAV